MPAFGIVVLAPIVVTYVFVNPLERGFDTIFRSELFQAVEHNPRLREGKWLVFSRDPTQSGFVTAVGCDVFTGLKYVPDLKDLALFDPKGINRPKFNQSGYLLADLRPGVYSEDFEVVREGLVIWDVNPLDYRLRQIGIRHLAFSSQPPREILQTLKPAANNPVSGLWIYDLP